MTMGIAPCQERETFWQAPQSSLSSDPTATVPVFLAGRMASTKQNIWVLWRWGGNGSQAQLHEAQMAVSRQKGQRKALSPSWTDASET